MEKLKKLIPYQDFVNRGYSQKEHKGKYKNL